MSPRHQALRSFRLPFLSGLLACVLASSGAITWLAKRESAPPQKIQDGPAPAQPVRTIAVVTADHAPPPTVYRGRVEAVQRGSIAFQVPGQVREILVDAGARVAAGQVLARLDATRFAAAAAAVDAQLVAARARLQELITGPRPERLARARAAVEEARLQAAWTASTAGRFKAALAEQSVSARDEEAARRTAEIAAAALNRARTQLDELTAGTRAEQRAVQRATVAQLTAERTRIRRDLTDCSLTAGFAGVVQRRQIEQGEVVVAGQPAFTLVGQDRLRVRVGLAATDRATTDIKTRIASVSVAGQVAPIDRADITLLPRVDARVRTRDVLIPLRDGTIAPDGATAKVAVEGARRTGIAIPRSALRPAPRGLFRCFVAEPDPQAPGSYRARGRDLRLEGVIGDQVLVTAGLAPGSLLICPITDSLVRGAPVAPQEDNR